MDGLSHTQKFPSKEQERLSTHSHSEARLRCNSSGEVVSILEVEGGTVSEKSWKGGKQGSGGLHTLPIVNGESSKFAIEEGQRQRERFRGPEALAVSETEHDILNFERSLRK